ncbi:hypothetical protein K437DRAFT_258159 [Tilletiaria anomala UBC 951]|uniref:PIN domain-like protein n=1 Tax=Tilletiaria anomala (strain ATCC 24038 / CBS 436.72 / UBC 951) TaxID=1037660 RepID=A0A066VN06_TILAU|nr:uncharacterized protein K437DRAFT_258159 [Tilletiaria anomala UBC 951]KDN41673.1 hypothetical protein K437DRAFT_258159 [Tilletiaria anomala UBC 951]
MGIIYLTSYVKKIYRSISDQLTFPAINDEVPHAATPAATGGNGPQPAVTAEAAKGTSGKRPTVLVIDAWAWIFYHFLHYFVDLTRGGEYARWHAHVRRYCTVLKRCNLKPVFVFDGPLPPTKLDAVLARREHQFRSNSLFMRLSPNSRTSPSVQAQAGYIPPLLSYVLIQALREEGVELVFSESEADSLVAEEAERRGGYAVSNDSDMYVLCSRGEGCGYVPLASFEYLVQEPVSNSGGDLSAEPAASNWQQGSDDGFEVVGRKGKATARRLPATNTSNTSGEASAPSAVAEVYTLDVLADQTAVVGEDATGDDTAAAARPILSAVRFSVHSPTKLAAHLGIPATFLPLLAAFVGNDHTVPEYTLLLEQRLPHNCDRIQAVASLIKTEWQKLGRSGGSRQPASPEVSRGSKTPTRRVGLGRLAGPAFSTLSSGRAASEDGRSDGGRTAPSSGTATPTRQFANDAAARRALSATSSSTPSGRLGDHFTAAEVSTALAIDPVRGLVTCVLDQILALRSLPASQFGKSAAAAQSVERYTASGERERLIAGLLDSVAVYSLLTHHAAPHLNEPAAEFFVSQPSIDVLPTKPLNASWWNMRPNLRALAAYQEAYRQGHFNHQLVDILTQRICIPLSFAEDPDAPSVHVGVARQLRRWVCAVLFGAWGMSWARREIEEPVLQDEEYGSQSETEAETHASPQRVRWIGGGDYASEEDPDELISVGTPTSFDTDEEGPLSRMMRDEADEAAGDGHENNEDAGSEGSVAELQRQADQEAAAHIKPAPIVTEWVRSGERRKGDPVVISSLSEMLSSSRSHLPPSLLDLLGQYEAHEASLEEASRSASATAHNSMPGSPSLPQSPLPPFENRILQTDADPLPEAPPLLRLETRKDILFCAFGAQTPTFNQLQTSLQMVAAALRFLVAHEAERLGESSKRFNWTAEEIRAAVLASLWAIRGTLPPDVCAKIEKRAEAALHAASALRAAPTTRHIHLTNSIQAVYEAAELLVQSLLLTDALPISYVTAFEPPLLQAYLFAQGTQSGAGAGAGEAALITLPAVTREEKLVCQVIMEGVEEQLGIDLATARAEKKRAKKQARAAGASAGAAAAGGNKPVRPTAAIAARPGINPFALLGE